MQLFSADAAIFSKKKNLPMKTKKNRPQKLLIIGPNLFFHSPAHSQQPKIDFSYHKNVPPSICSLICAWYICSSPCLDAAFSVFK